MSRLITNKDVEPSDLSCHVCVALLPQLPTHFTFATSPTPAPMHVCNTQRLSHCTRNITCRYSHHTEAVACMDVATVNTTRGGRVILIFTGSYDHKAKCVDAITDELVRRTGAKEQKSMTCVASCTSHATRPPHRSAHTSAIAPTSSAAASTTGSTPAHTTARNP